MEQTIHYKPEHVCSRAIDIVVDDGIVKDVRFTGGCPGNTQAVAILAKGRKVEELITALEHVECPGSHGHKTSCPQEFAKALKSSL